MTSQDVLDIGTDALVLAAKLAAPFLLVVLGVGIVVGLVQSVTQIQEQTLAFVPKLIGAAVVIAVAGSWMLDQFVAFGTELFGRVPQLIQG